MDKNGIFQRNMQALSPRHDKLRLALQAAPKASRYSFSKARGGQIVPFIRGEAQGGEKPLHSTVDPEREGQRLVLSSARGGGVSGFFIFFGLGAAYAQEAALAAGGVSHVMVVDFDSGGVAELFGVKDYSKMLENPKFSLWVDPGAEELKDFIRQNYMPALCGPVITLPLRARVAQDARLFDAAAAAVKEALESVSKDYSVQAHFGIKWFSNIIRNLKSAQFQNFSAPSVEEAAVCAAGPSLDGQMRLLANEKDKKTFIISCDTALGALLHFGITPDAVVSIDCQHVSFYHFMGLQAKNIPLFLDISSPPLLSRFPFLPFFFSGGHPLALYASQRWRSLLRLDTSGANVAYACLSLAEALGARRVKLYGCDFSYPRGKTYARGTYVTPFFSPKQNRFAPLEALHWSFFCRSPFLPRQEGQAYYETEILKSYRQKIEEKSRGMEAEVIAVQGEGPWINLPKKNGPKAARAKGFFKGAAAKTSPAVFLERYSLDIAALPLPAPDGGPANGATGGNYWQALDGKNRLILSTALPLAAALLRRNPGIKTRDLIGEVKTRCRSEIDAQLKLTALTSFEGEAPAP